MAVADILRYLRYHEVYGKRQRARELYQALPPEARDLATADLAAAQAACPHGLPVVELLHRADRADGLIANRSCADAGDGSGVLCRVHRL